MLSAIIFLMLPQFLPTLIFQLLDRIMEGTYSAVRDEGWSDDVVEMSMVLILLSFCIQNL